MKKALKLFLIAVTLKTLPLAMTAQVPPHPNGGGGPGGGNIPVGGGTPVGGGIIILLALVAGYGARKVYNMRLEAREKER